ncbi:MAG: Gfo/Idh/MocA family oxidoreductase [Anaerolineales bacterium]|nr:Gfo/Idh/MocA family oxidoreductase [Anaerolineales bacterium]
MLKVGVIGTGGMGGRHVRNLYSQTPAQVVAVMDVDAARVQEVADSVGGCAAYTDTNALINDPNVEAVVIASPDPFHKAAALACIAAGKPTLCEKPLAMNTVEAKEVLDAEVAGGKRLLQLAFMREYDPAHLAVKAVADSGKIGDLLMFRGLHTNLALPHARTAEDVIGNSSVHDIHSARWLMQQEVTQVYSQVVPSDPTRPETCRLLLTHMRFANGGLGLIEVNAEAGYGYQVNVELTGSAGTTSTPRPAAALVKTVGQEWLEIEPNWLVRFEVAYIAEVQAWVQSVIDGRPTGPSTWDGYAAMVVVDACVASFKSGEPQAVPELKRPFLYD